MIDGLTSAGQCGRLRSSVDAIVAPIANTSPYRRIEKTCAAVSSRSLCTVYIQRFKRAPIVCARVCIASMAPH